MTSRIDSAPVRSIVAFLTPNIIITSSLVFPAHPKLVPRECYESS